jgi:L-arabinonolactonase
VSTSLRLPLPDRDLLGESPVWDSRTQMLYWVDSRGSQVHGWDGAGPPKHWGTPQEIGSIALAKPGHLLLALANRFAMLDLDRQTVTPLAEIQHPRPPMRLNDGRTDREGRFVCGSMVLHRRDAEGSLYMLDSEGRVTVLLDRCIAVANSTCFSPDGRTLYHADSLAGVIRAWDYGLDGAISHERLFVDTRLEGSGPDGATVDAEGCLWVALVLAAKVARYAPDGHLLATLDLPVPYPTCPCFGGPGLDTLYVTSLRDSGNLLKSDVPAAGALVAVNGLGARGLPEVPYRYNA